MQQTCNIIFPASTTEKMEIIFRLIIRINHYTLARETEPVKRVQSPLISRSHACMLIEASSLFFNLKGADCHLVRTP